MIPEANIVLLTNFVAPYRIPMLEAVAKRVGDLRIWVSTLMEANRPWRPASGTLQVEVQRCLTFNHRSRHPHGYVEQQLIHIPYDTILRLRRHRPDVVVSAEFGARTVQALLYCAATATPSVVWATVSESSEKGRGPARRLLRRALLPRADAVLVNGRSGARYVQELGARPERIVTVPQTSGLPEVRAVERVVSRHEHRLLYVGQLIERKGVVPFLTALGRWGGRHPEETVTLELVRCSCESRMNRVNFARRTGSDLDDPDRFVTFAPTGHARSSLGSK